MATYTLQELWDKACTYDAIPPDTRFAVFSYKNPWADKYFKLRNLMAKYGG